MFEAPNTNCDHYASVCHHAEREETDGKCEVKSCPLLYQLGIEIPKAPEFGIVYPVFDRKKGDFTYYAADLFTPDGESTTHRYDIPSRAAVLGKLGKWNWRPYAVTNEIHCGPGFSVPYKVYHIMREGQR